MNTFIVFACLIAVAFASGKKCEWPKQDFLDIIHFNECEGKDASNYTLVHTYQNDVLPRTNKIRGNVDNLVQGDSHHGQLANNQLRVLAHSTYPAGAFAQLETLWVAIAGPLEGKYLYEKTIILLQDYIKKRSSVLGYSYVTTKSSSLLINERLELQVLISPTGGYEVFKKGCTTICRGNGYTV
ncbi:uncharacterized protein LOC128960130 [Oppia nitens]|uniref:uncharacterized protein LOC128960130 n=1 Tax=Oppia nitens TaxID=1686743 RepID=UPI0023D9D3B5|nr:uncharacterized protein LOC128960130 [Oppia nitens]